MPGALLILQHPPIHPLPDVEAKKVRLQNSRASPRDRSPAGPELGPGTQVEGNGFVRANKEVCNLI